ncbi:hypothetical protein ABFA07_002736 [Porites harrisoni]
MEVNKCLLFAAFFLVACVAFSSQDELTDVEAPALQQAADNDVQSPELTDGEDVEDEEDTEIAEDDVGEDEDSDEMQEENDLEDPLWKGRRRRRRCRGLRKCFFIKSCRRRVCVCLRRRRRRTRPYYDETGSENEVNNAEDEVEEFEGTEDFEDPIGKGGKVYKGKGRRRRPRRRCRKLVRKCFTRKLGKLRLIRRRTCVRLCLRRCFYGDENANDN